MIRAFRILYAALAWLFLAGIVGQVFLIGLYLFNHQSIDAHATFGWMLHLSPILILLFAFLARAGRSHWLWALALAVVVFIVPILAIMRSSNPVVAALHPVAAMLAFGLAAIVAWKSLGALRMPAGEPTPAGPGAGT